MNKVFIYEALRTPRAIAKPSGGLYELSPLDQLKQLYSALAERSGFDFNCLDDVVLGCVSQMSEQGGNIAKASITYSALPEHIPGITINRFCSSSLDAVCLAFDSIRSGSKQAVISGGVESMSRVPMLSDQPVWMTDPGVALRARFIPLGNSADLIASQEGFSRIQLDQYALQSQQRAATAQDKGYFDKSVVAITLGEGRQFSKDEVLRRDSSLESLSNLTASFTAIGAAGADAALLKVFPELQRIDHLHTAGNSPAMADGASLLLVGGERIGGGLSPRAEILAYKSCSGSSELGLTGGNLATQQLLDSVVLTPNDIDLFEYNESFAAPTLKFIKDFGISSERINVNGGAIALGHPMGATGGMLIGSVLDELQRRDQEMALVAVCGAGGSGTAMLIKNIRNA